MSYCQMIREVNKEKRLRWAQTYLDETSDGFLDIVWTDESTVQLESHHRLCCKKKGEKPRNIPRYSNIIFSLYVCPCTCAHLTILYVPGI